VCVYFTHHSNNTSHGKTKMQVSIEQLNAVATFLDTTDKNLVFSVCIKTLVDAGVSVREAVDAVLGTGRFDDIASDIYNKLTA
jgi:hypothetical protein